MDKSVNQISKEDKNSMPKLNIELYKKMYLIRRAEEKIRAYYHEDDMKTPMHMSMGEEAIAVGICHALKKEDQVFGTYRSHAIYLAKTLDADNFFAEMYGKDTARLKGKGGSMHLCAPDHGFMVTSAIVASAIPVAVGAAFANKMKKNDKMIAVFFGDGAVDEGVFWESLNVACLMKLPVLFVCEDNELAVHTHARLRRGYVSITKIVEKFNCRVFKEKTTDVASIYRMASQAIKVAKASQIPAFVHLRYYRYLEHVGVNEDFDAGYRSRDEFEKWVKVDPIRLQRSNLTKLGIAEEAIRKCESEIEAKIGNSIAKAKNAPFAPICELYRWVFDEED